MDDPSEQVSYKLNANWVDELPLQLKSFKYKIHGSTKLTPNRASKSLMNLK